MKNIIFLFSLPRSGSTLLQRILTAHNAIYSVGEPWLLLPLFSVFKEDSSYTEYGHKYAHNASQNIISILPNGVDDYYNAISLFAGSIYEKLGKGHQNYFLDKTPRNYLIITEILQAFPRAKFIFLFRNPLQILASILRTWRGGKLRLANNYIDLYRGPACLAKGYEFAKSRAIKVCFEELISQPELVVPDILEYLELEEDNAILSKFTNISLSGKLGDPSGAKEYRHIDKAPTDKWKNILNTSYRKKFAKNYLATFSEDTLNTFGYSISDLTQAIDEIEPVASGAVVDRYNLLYDTLYRALEIHMFKQNKPNFLKNKHNNSLHH